MGPFIEAEACCDVGKTKSGAWRVPSSVLCRRPVLWALGLQTVEASLIRTSYGESALGFGSQHFTEGERKPGKPCDFSVSFISFGFWPDKIEIIAHTFRFVEAVKGSNMRNVWYTQNSSQ